MKTKGICKLTGATGVFVNAHIIPRAFFERSREARNEPLEILGSRPPQRPKISRTGLYDPELVTAEGEDRFNLTDDYAAKLLLPRPTRSQFFRDERGFIARKNGTPLAYQIPNYNYPLLKLFFISVLWRISASTRPELANLRLSVEQDLRNRILSGDPGPPEDFSVILYRYSDLGVTPALLPFKTHLEGVQFVKFVCGSFGVHIKVDGSPTPLPFADTQICPDRPLTILLKRFDDSPDKRAMLKIITKPHNAEPSRKHENTK